MDVFNSMDTSRLQGVNAPYVSFTCLNFSATMVYLTMTSIMVSALETIIQLELKLENDVINSDYSLANPAIGNPIGHSQVIAISKLLDAHNSMLSEDSNSYHLDNLLRGSKIYTSPPKPQIEPVSCNLMLAQAAISPDRFIRHLATRL